MTSFFTTLSVACGMVQVTSRRVRLCNLWRLPELSPAADSDAEPSAVAGAAAAVASGHGTSAGYKRHASWAHLPGMEDRISEALARQRFLRPRWALICRSKVPASPIGDHESWSVSCCTGPLVTAGFEHGSTSHVRPRSALAEAAHKL